MPNDLPAWIAPIVDFVHAHPQWAWACLFGVAFIESFLVIGLIVPGMAILCALGAMIGVGALDLATAWLFCSLGGWSADLLGFQIGRRYQDRFAHSRWIQRYPHAFERAHRFFHERGAFGVFLARFIGPIRPFMPFVCGAMDMPPRRFITVSALACTLWSPVFLLPGLALGASLDLAQAALMQVLILVVIATVLLWALDFALERGRRRWIPDHPPWAVRMVLATLVVAALILALVMVIQDSDCVDLPSCTRQLLLAIGTADWEHMVD